MGGANGNVEVNAYHLQISAMGIAMGILRIVVKVLTIAFQKFLMNWNSTRTGVVKVNAYQKNKNVIVNVRMGLMNVETHAYSPVNLTLSTKCAMENVFR